MKIVIDNIVFNLQKSGGISVVWFELLSRMACDNHIDMRYIDNGGSENPYRKKLDILNDAIIGVDMFVPISRYLPVCIHNKESFIFHSSYYRFSNNPYAINITTVHDFTYEYYRKGPAKWLHCWQKYQAVRHSQYIVCISESTKRDLLKFVPDIDESKIRIIYNGVSDDYCVLDKSENISTIPFEKNKYVIFVGNRFGYKNFDFLKKTLAKSEYNLVIVGSPLTVEEKKDLERYIPHERYFCTGFLPNKELNVLYNHAAALVYPSSYEGFGIPVVEAQKAGCPVIAYNSSSIPEVIGDTPLLMNELSEMELLKKMSLLTDNDLMKCVREDGLKNSARFSWEKMYQKYYDLYREAYLQVK
jgi:mannosyltransferase